MNPASKLAPVRTTVPIEYQPFPSLANRINRLFEEALAPFGFREESLALPIWTPSCDVYETESEMVLNLEIPGIKKEDIKVQIEGNLLTVSGERKFEHEVKEHNFRRLERSYGEFTRSFTLPPTLDLLSLIAEAKEGVLRIVIKKREEAKAKTVEVKVK